MSLVIFQNTKGHDLFSNRLINYKEENNLLIFIILRMDIHLLQYLENSKLLQHIDSKTLLLEYYLLVFPFLSKQLLTRST